MAFLQTGRGKKSDSSSLAQCVKDTVKQYSPILADMVALKTADFTIDELAEQFIQLIQ